MDEKDNVLNDVAFQILESLIKAIKMILEKRIDKTFDDSFRLGGKVYVISGSAPYRIGTEGTSNSLLISIISNCPNLYNKGVVSPNDPTTIVNDNGISENNNESGIFLWFNCKRALPFESTGITNAVSKFVLGWPINNIVWWGRDEWDPRFILKLSDRISELPRAQDCVNPCVTENSWGEILGRLDVILILIEWMVHACFPKINGNNKKVKNQKNKLFITIFRAKKKEKWKPYQKLLLNIY